MKVLRKLLRSTPFWRPGVLGVLRKRLAMYHKAAGDAAWQEGRRETARAEYLSSFSYWPFDHVVGIRCAWWSVRLAFGAGASTKAKL